MSPYDNRDPKTIAAVPCVVCGAAIGEPCVGIGAPMISVHGERRAAWQAVRGPVAPIMSATPCTCGHGSGRHAYDGGCERCDCTLTRNDVRGRSK